jgi:hypothetical protein
VGAVEFGRDLHGESQAASASAVYSVSGVAERKLPPIAKKTFARPGVHRLDRLHRVEAVRARRLEVELARERVEEGGVGRSQMPIVRSPCTFEWPRTGQTPAPRCRSARAAAGG